MPDVALMTTSGKSQEKMRRKSDRYDTHNHAQPSSRLDCIARATKVVAARLGCGVGVIPMQRRRRHPSVERSWRLRGGFEAPFWRSLACPITLPSALIRWDRPQAGQLIGL